MNRIVITLLASFLMTSAWAVETLNGSGNTIYQTTPPTGAQVPSWTTGWGQSGITGWNYVGQIGGASGVYLGNGWVLTAGHVGAGAFTLSGVTYQAISGSAQSFTNLNGTADLTLFQISAPPALPPLTISVNAPTAFSQTNVGSSTVIIGYGGGKGESWGYDTVDVIDQLVTPSGYTYVSTDFLTVYGTFTSGTASSTNNSNLVGGDSGGGDFIYNTADHSWELAGINEVEGTGTINNQNVTISGFVQVNAYASQIIAHLAPASSDSPTIPLPGLLVMACLLLFGASRSLNMRAAQARKK